jgi:hypothetical protein
VINVQDLVAEPSTTPSQPYTILRSTVGSQFVQGGFDSVTFPITMFGPVQQAQPKEIAMLPEADRVGAIRSFWSTIPVYVTRGYAPAPVTHGEVAAGAVPGTVYTLSAAPPNGMCNVVVSGLLLPPSAYVVAGTTLTLQASTTITAPWVTWPATADVQQAAADKIGFEGFTYRVLSVYYDPSTGYWKALGTREEAA